VRRAPRECKACVAPPSSPQPPKRRGHAQSSPSQNFFVIRNLRESQAKRVQAGCCFRRERPPLFDAETTALLRAVVEDVCESVSRYETSARIHVASMILEAASKGETSVEG
jgi:hypothetical protein